MVPVLPNRCPKIRDLDFEYEGYDYKICDNKLLDDRGNVAVVISPGFGCGLSTWIHCDPTDARIALAVLTDQEVELEGLDEYDSERLLGIRDRTSWLFGFNEFAGDPLDIEWVPKGSMFRVTEYDGSESIQYSYDQVWNVA